VAQSTLDTALKYGPLALGVGGAVYNRYAASQYAKQLKNVGADQRAVGESLIQQYQSGKLNPADQYAIDQWEQGAVSQMKDYYARAGMADSSVAQNAAAEIHNKAVAMKQQALNNLLTMGTNILNTTDQYQQMAIQAEMQGDQAMAQNALLFLSAYGSWLRGMPQLTGGSRATA
jgi:hypothetical protein